MKTSTRSSMNHAITASHLSFLFMMLHVSHGYPLMSHLVNNPSRADPPLPSSPLYPTVPVLTLAVVPKIIPKTAPNDIKLTAIPNANIPSSIRTRRDSFAWSDADVAGFQGQWHGLPNVINAGALQSLYVEQLPYLAIGAAQASVSGNSPFAGVIGVSCQDSSDFVVHADLWLSHSSPLLRRPLSYGIPATHDSIFFPAGVADTRAGMSGNVPPTEVTGITGAVRGVVWRFIGWPLSVSVENLETHMFHEFFVSDSRLSTPISGSRLRPGFAYMVEGNVTLTAGISLDYGVFNALSGSDWLLRTAGSFPSPPAAASGTADILGGSVRPAFLLGTGGLGVGLVGQPADGAAFKTLFGFKALLTGDAAVVGGNFTSATTSVAARAAFLAANFFGPPEQHKVFTNAVATGTVLAPDGAKLCPRTVSWLPQYYQCLRSVATALLIATSDDFACQVSRKVTNTLPISTSGAGSGGATTPSNVLVSFRLIRDAAFDSAALSPTYFDDVNLEQWIGVPLTSFSFATEYSTYLSPGAGDDYSVFVLAVAAGPDGRFKWAGQWVRAVPANLQFHLNTTEGMAWALNDTLLTIRSIAEAAGADGIPTSIFDGPLQDASRVYGMLVTAINGSETSNETQELLDRVRDEILSVVTNTMTKVGATNGSASGNFDPLAAASVGVLLNMSTSALPTDDHEAMAIKILKASATTFGATKPNNDNTVGTVMFPSAVAETGVSIINNVLGRLRSVNLTAQGKGRIANLIDTNVGAIIASLQRTITAPSNNVSEPVYLGVESICQGEYKLNDAVVIGVVRSSLSVSAGNARIPPPVCSLANAQAVTWPTITVPARTLQQAAINAAVRPRAGIDIIFTNIPASSVYNTTSWLHVLADADAASAALQSLHSNKLASAVKDRASTDNPAMQSIREALPGVGALAGEATLPVRNSDHAAGIDSPILSIVLQTPSGRDVPLRDALEPVVFHVPLENGTASRSAQADYEDIVYNVTCPVAYNTEMLVSAFYTTKNDTNMYATLIDMVNVSYWQPLPSRKYASSKLLPFTGESAMQDVLNGDMMSYFQPTVQGDYLERVTRPVYIFRADCGAAVGDVNFTCGPGYYNSTIQFRCPTVMTLPSCVFLNTTASKWHDKGCRVVNVSNTAFSCECDHLTNFAARFAAVAVVNKEVFAISTKLENITTFAWYPYVFIVLGALLFVFLLCCVVGINLDASADVKFYESLAADHEIRTIQLVDEVSGDAFVLDRMLDRAEDVRKSKERDPMRAAAALWQAVVEKTGTTEQSLAQIYAKMITPMKLVDPVDGEDEENQQPVYYHRNDMGLFQSLEAVFRRDGLAGSLQHRDGHRGIKTMLKSMSMRHIPSEINAPALLCHELATDVAIESNLGLMAASAMYAMIDGKAEGVVAEPIPQKNTSMERAALLRSKSAYPTSPPPPQAALSPRTLQQMSPRTQQTALRNEGLGVAAMMVQRYANDELVNTNINENELAQYVSGPHRWLPHQTEAKSSVKVSKKCCRCRCNCGYLWLWFARLLFNHIYIGWLATYDPIVRRPQRIFIMIAVLLGNLCAAGVLFGYRVGRNNGELPPMDLSEVIVVALLSALVQVPIELSARLLMRYGGQSVFKWRYPSIWSEIAQRRIAERRFSKLSTEALEAQILLTAPTTALSETKSSVDSEANSMLQLAPTALLLRSAATGVLMPRDGATDSAKFQRMKAVGGKLEHFLNARKTKAPVFSYDWVDAPRSCVTCCGCFLRVCGRHPSQKGAYLERRRREEFATITRAALVKQRELMAHASSHNVNGIVASLVKKSSRSGVMSFAVHRNGAPAHEHTDLSAIELGALEVDDELGEDEADRPTSASEWLTGTDWSKLQAVDPTPSCCAKPKGPSAELVEEIFGDDDLLRREAKGRAVRGCRCGWLVFTGHCAIAHIVLLIWMIFCLYFLFLFGLLQPASALRSYLTSWGISQAVAVGFTQPMLALIHVGWWFLVVPAISSWATWFGSCCRRAVGPYIRSNNVDDDGPCLTSRLEALAIAQAAGVASGLSPNSAALTFGGSAALTAAVSAIMASADVNVLAGLGAYNSQIPDIPLSMSMRHRRELMVRRYLMLRLKIRSAVVRAAALGVSVAPHLLISPRGQTGIVVAGDEVDAAPITSRTPRSTPRSGGLTDRTATNERMPNPAISPVNRTTAMPLATVTPDPSISSPAERKSSAMKRARTALPGLRALNTGGPASPAGSGIRSPPPSSQQPLKSAMKGAASPREPEAPAISPAISPVVNVRMPSPSRRAGMRRAASEARALHSMQRNQGVVAEAPIDLDGVQFN